MHKSSVLAVAALLGLSVSAANAQDTITLRVAHTFPANHTAWVQGGKVFTDAVTAATGGKVKFEVFPNAQLGRDSLALLERGVVDLAIIPASATPDKLPLSQMIDLPGLASSACEGAARFWGIVKPGAILNEAEYSPKGIQVLYVALVDAARLFTSKQKVSKLADISGLKIKANSGPQILIRNLGGIGITMSPQETYDALSRGTIDGITWPTSLMPLYGLEKVTRYGLVGVPFGQSNTLFGMSKASWNKLPQNVKDAMQAAAMPAQNNICQFSDAEEKKVRDAIAAQPGYEISTLSPGEAALWKTKIEEVASQWATERDALKLPASAVLKAFRDIDPSKQN